MDDPNDLDTIKIYLPIHIERQSIEDLGPCFRSVEIAQGIFNESLSSVLRPSGKCVELREEDTVFCQVFIFSDDSAAIDEHELSVQPQGNGTILSVTRQALSSLGNQSPSSQRGYFRLRVKPSDPLAAPFLTTIKPDDHVWNSGFEVIEYIDCRLNEARTLPRSIESAFQAAKYGVASTRIIAFLAVVPVVSSVTSSHTAWHKSRLLEREIWEQYVPQDLEDGMVVYHWKKIFDQIEDKRLVGFSAFVKLHTRRSGATIIMTYLLLAFLLGVMGSVFGSTLYEHFFGSGSGA